MCAEMLSAEKARFYGVQSPTLKPLLDAQGISAELLSVENALIHGVRSGRVGKASSQKPKSKHLPPASAKSHKGVGGSRGYEGRRQGAGSHEGADGHESTDCRQVASNHHWAGGHEKSELLTQHSV
jgi:hypothetical protein